MMTNYAWSETMAHKTFTNVQEELSIREALLPVDVLCGKSVPVSGYVGPDLLDVCTVEGRWPKQTVPGC